MKRIELCRFVFMQKKGPLGEVVAFKLFSEFVLN